MPWWKEMFGQSEQEMVSEFTELGDQVGTLSRMLYSQAMDFGRQLRQAWVSEHVQPDEPVKHCDPLAAAQLCDQGMTTDVSSAQPLIDGIEVTTYFAHTLLKELRSSCDVSTQPMKEAYARLCLAKGWKMPSYALSVRHETPLSEAHAARLFLAACREHQRACAALNVQSSNETVPSEQSVTF